MKLFELDNQKQIGDLQGDLLQAMMDEDYNSTITNWTRIEDTELYDMFYVDPMFKKLFESIFLRYLHTSMDGIVCVSSAKSSVDTVLGLLKFIQPRAIKKYGINPSTLNDMIKVEHYVVRQASVFYWGGYVFLVIKDTAATDTHYHIYAAVDKDGHATT